ncbi:MULTISPECIES: complex I NDUFA9 subunit family protein [Halorubrum]|uniref:Complex I NDUFA9 subunit family protein n=1 Tax=Halorubrum persicum TaxID=1383844 RepID=A0A2G1WIK5_9EURY|nr:complex I NDUFA9 subunit family protein [Halorubrum persicum]OYR51872.1 complex I NDUFA9 subunit family protein [Halorubrum sp. E3]PHQ38669.1 complex I NDUFA9 subunit family protein [Halorubrum persicum]
MKVLVAGGTGFIGSYLCRALADGGHEVTALSRSSSDTPEGVASATGDVTDYDSIAGAVDGQDAVVNLVALSPLFEPKGGNVMHDRIHRGGTENLVRAAEEGGADRFLQLSALGADPTGDTAYIRAKGEAEAIVRESGLDWTIFRPSVVFGEGGEFVSFTKRLKGMFAPGVPLYPLPGGGKTRFQPIHVEDLVPMLVAALEEDEHVGETYEVGGPEVLTLREVTDLVYEAERKGVTIVPLPMPLARIGLSVLGAVPGFPMGADQYRSLKFDNTTANNDAAAFGVDSEDLTTLGTHLGVE